MTFLSNRYKIPAMVHEVARSVYGRFLGIICLAMTAGILAVGLYPFNFWPRNEVEWLKDRNGLHFYGRGLIFSEFPTPNTLPPLSFNLPFSVEIYLQPDSDSRPYLPHILSFYDGNGSETFFLGQWKSHLILRTRTLDPKGKPAHKEIGLKDALHRGQIRFIAIAADERRTTIYVDGKTEKSYPNYTLIPKGGSTSGRIVLGNSSTGNDYWTGNLFALAISNRSLTEDGVLQHIRGWKNEHNSLLAAEEGMVALYPFDEHSGTLTKDHVGGHHLLIPSRFRVLQKTVLVPPWEDFRLNRSYLTDVVTNILGFIPFGFFLSAYLWWRERRSIYRLVIVTVLIGGFVSLSIELIQVYLPSRNSQLTDVMTNILGTAIGASLFFKCRKISGIRRKV